MNLNKLSKKQINSAVILCLFVIGAAACSKSEKPGKYVLKIDGSVLTEEQINSALADKRNSGKLREEFIQNWIEKEILFREAVKNGIPEEKEFNSIMEQSKKELAASMLIKKIADNENTAPSDDEILQYYDNNKSDFKLNDDLYIVNIVYFDGFENAVRFRDRVMENGWRNALDSPQSRNTFTAAEEAKMLFRYQLQPLLFLRTVSALQKDEIGSVMETEPGKFAVVQLIDRLNRDIIPPLSVVREEVKARSSVIKKREIIKKYIDKLIADHNLEIKRYSE